MEATNQDRASWGNTALSAFVVEVGDAGDEQTNLSDLLADLMHLADRQDLDFAQALMVARGHYAEEVIY